MKVKKILLFCLPFIASAVMLTVIQPPIGWAPLAWVALVPFILACSPTAKLKSLALAAYLVSLCYWLGNLYWILPITLLGWLAFCLYTALLWPILAFALRFCRIKKMPVFIAVPILLVGAERLQGLFLGGFFWRFLAHSQYANITLIQIADIFGAAGVSFLVAMVNGLLAELIIAAGGKNIFKARQLLKTATVCAALAAAIIYGRWRINQSDRCVTKGPLVAAVQSNVPQSIKRSFQQSETIFDDLMQNSKASAEAGAELIVWPETMVQATLNPEVLALLDSSHSYRIFDKALSEHSRDTAFVLVGAYGGIPDIWQTSLAQRYNSAFLYRPDGKKADEHYNKIHLVPFGEFIPFRKKLPPLFKLLMKFTPYNFDYSLDAGTEYTIFEMTGQAKKLTAEKKIEHRASSIEHRVYKFSVMICYEDTVPAIARRFAISRKGQKRIDFALNISNDGWFVKFKTDPARREPNGRVTPTTELAQHTAICAFRAVENRLAVLRSVNTGISCLIDTLGHIKNGHLAGNLPDNYIARQGIAGWFVDRVPIDKRATLFSKYGQWLDFSCALCLVSLVIVAGVKLKVKNGERRK